MTPTIARRAMITATSAVAACGLALGGAVAAHAEVDTVYTWVGDESYYVAQASTTDASTELDSYPFGVGWHPRGIELDATTTYSLMDYGFSVRSSVVGGVESDVEAADLIEDEGVVLVTWDTGTSSVGNFGENYVEEFIVYDDAFVADSIAELDDVWALDITPDGRLLTLAQFTIAPGEGEPYSIVVIAEVDPETFFLEPIVDITTLADSFLVTGIGTDPTTEITYLLIASEGVGFVTVDLSSGELGVPTELTDYLGAGEYYPGDIDFDYEGTAYLLNDNDELLTAAAPFGTDAAFSAIGGVADLLSVSAIATEYAVEEEPELAATGVESGPVALAAVGAVGLGVLALLLARRRLSRS